MKPRYGPRQLAALRALAEHADGLTVQGIAAVLQAVSGNHAAVQAGLRRGLAAMQRAGLTDGSGRREHEQGRPTIWRITQAGRDFLSARERSEHDRQKEP